MIHKVILIIAVYFLIGAIGLMVIQRRKGRERFGKQWTKYFMYLFIVTSLVAIIQTTDVFVVPMVLVMLLALLELLRVFRKSSKGINIFFINSQLLFVSIALCFLRFIFDSSREELLFVYTLVFTFDGFSQIAGQLFGKRLLMPTISPNKTLEGLLGGFLASMFTAFVLSSELPISLSAFYTTVILLAGFAGDGLASWYKRYYQVKDYGTYIPAHGGLLDRFDSFLASGAMYQILKHIFFTHPGL